MDEASNLFRAITTRSFKSNTEEMAAGFVIFGDAVREWLQEPDDEEPQLESISLLLAASDEYEPHKTLHHCRVRLCSETILAATATPTPTPLCSKDNQKPSVARED